MILADTSIWINHFRKGDERLSGLLRDHMIVMHPFVIAELALGSIADRTGTLRYLDSLPCLRVAQQHEVRRMIEARSLWGQGIGLMDAHLLASALLYPSTLLWTADKRLRAMASVIRVEAVFPES